MMMKIDNPTDGFWRFGRIGDDGNMLLLLPDGSVGGYDHPNERQWRLDADALELCDGQGIATSRFVLADATSDRLPGQSAGGIPLFLERGDWQPIEPPTNLTRTLYEREIAEHGWTIGRHTYGSPGVAERESALHIGSYCSIASGSLIALGNHKLNAVTTYPFAALRRHWYRVPRDAQDHTTRGDVAIGSDVWIGSYAFIGSGITIGHGAVIAAHAVVTRDVPPYAIVGGNPARVLRHRFTAAQIERLLAIAWWDWPEDKVDANIPLLLDEDIDAFIAAHS